MKILESDGHGDGDRTAEEAVVALHEYDGCIMCKLSVSRAAQHKPCEHDETWLEESMSIQFYSVKYRYRNKE
jgi:hypothetical protein